MAAATSEFVPHDTDPEAHRVQIEAYRRIGLEGRAAALFRLMALAREVAVNGIRSRHPEYDEEEVRRAFLRLRYGDAVALEVWPTLPLVDP